MQTKSILGRLGIAFAMLLAVLTPAFADAPAWLGTGTDPSAITTTATSVFNDVSVLVVAVVGFYILVRIIKGIRGR